MNYLTRFIKGDTIEMNGETFKLLSDGYYSSEHQKVICNTDTKKGWVSYWEMIDNDAKILSYEKKFKNF